MPRLSDDNQTIFIEAKELNKAAVARSSQYHLVIRPEGLKALLEKKYDQNLQIKLSAHMSCSHVQNIFTQFGYTQIAKTVAGWATDQKTPGKEITRSVSITAATRPSSISHENNTVADVQSILSPKDLSEIKKSQANPADINDHPLIRINYEISQIDKKLTNYLNERTTPADRGVYNLVMPEVMRKRALENSIFQFFRDNELSIARLEKVVVLLLAELANLQQECTGQLAVTQNGRKSVQTTEWKDIDSELLNNFANSVIRRIGRMVQDAITRNQAFSQIKGLPITSGELVGKLLDIKNDWEKLRIGRKDATDISLTGGNAQGWQISSSNSLEKELLFLKGCINLLLTKIKTNYYEPNTVTQYTNTQIKLSPNVVRYFNPTGLGDDELTKARLQRIIVPCYQQLYYTQEKIDLLMSQLKFNHGFVSKTPCDYDKVFIVSTVVRDINNNLNEAIHGNIQLSRAYGKAERNGTAYQTLQQCLNEFSLQIKTEYGVSLESAILYKA